MGIEMTFGEALDQIRSFQTRFVRPFEKLAEVMETAIEVDAALAERQRELASVLGQIAETEGVLKELSEAVLITQRAADQAEAAAHLRQEEAERAERHASDWIADLLRREAEQTEAFERRAAEQQDALKAQYAELHRMLEHDISHLISTKRELEAALAELREKFSL